MQRLTMADRLMIGAIVVWLIVFALIASKAFGHEGQLLKCSNYYAEAVKTGEAVLENGMLAEAYDTDGDGIANVNTLSIVSAKHPTETHNPFPLFYWIDTNQDDIVDLVFIDVFGEGACNSIVAYSSNGKTYLDTKRTLEQ